MRFHRHLPLVRRAVFAWLLMLPFVWMLILVGGARLLHAGGPVAAMASVATILADAAPASPAPPCAPGIATAGYAHGDDGDLEWAYVDPSDGNTLQISNRDWHPLLDRLRDEKQPVLWFAMDGREYLVRDRVLVARAKRVVQPLMEIGRRQGALGARQGALGARQGRIGARMGMLGGRMGALSAHAASSRRSDAARERYERERDELREQMDRLREAQEPLAREQRRLGAQQRALGEQHQAILKDVQRDLRELIGEARREGKATRGGDTEI